MKGFVFALAVCCVSLGAAEEISLRDILDLKEQIRQDREEIAVLQAAVSCDESDRESEIAELKAVLSHQEREIAELNREIHTIKRKQPNAQAPVGGKMPVCPPPKESCAPKCPPPCPKPCCPPPPCVVKEPLPVPCCRYPMMMRYRSPIEESEFAFRGEFLIWKTAVNPADYALAGQQNQPNVATGAIGPYSTYDYDWDPGLRLAVQYRFPDNYWQAEMQYTYFSNSGNDSVEGGSNAFPVVGEKFLVGTFQTALGEPATSARANIDLDYQVLDFYLGRRFMLADSMILKCLLGVSGAWIDQDLDVRYEGFGVSSAHYTNSWSYSAGGIKAGITSDWFLGYGFGIYSQLVFGGFVGNWDGSCKDLNVDNTGERTTLRNASYEDTRFALTTQFQLGLAWQWLFENANLRLFVGYEMNPWLNINELIDSSDQDNNTRSRLTRNRNGVIAPQGVTINAQIGF